MPVPPPELTAEVTVETVSGGERSPREQLATVWETAETSGLASESGPESRILSGREEEVLAALDATLRAALEAGARGVDVRVERPSEVRERA